MSTPSENPASETVSPLGGGAAPKSKYDDHRRPLLRALKYGTIGLVIVTVISLAAWGGAQGLPGIWGVLIGAAVGGGYVLLTALSILVTANTSTGATGAIVLGGWLVKLVLVMIIFIALDGLTFYHQWAFVVTLLVALIVVMVAELWGLITTNVTYTS
ncbi:hypothetical protein B841_05745 [Corynebacterium maris DSM 45190]|uniref:ATP synthase protein I n=1 Tax=Corynebacterium maris DSM 45190 TaxID=1224163 RepID=S5SUA3_9CORY|nr:hypothetical protein B841_05745 [Corynebacterium maris DSM 45190]